jgi:tripartite-type tricarboxylate transporter receptor subunit TctC
MNAMNRRAFARVAMAVPAASWLLPSFSQTGAGVGKLLVGYPAGGTLDTTARQLAEAWRKQGRPYIVDNRAGAAGRIANSQLKRERPDGGTLLCTHSSALTIYPNAAPASVLDVQTYVDWVRRAPGFASYASPAAGSFAHFLGYQLSDARD